MTELLQRAIAEIERLPADAQDAIAARILAELEDEQAWTVRFEATTDEQWARLAAMARQGITDGDAVEPPTSEPPVQTHQSDAAGVLGPHRHWLPCSGPERCGSCVLVLDRLARRV